MISTPGTSTVASSIRCEGLSVQFDDFVAVDSVSLTVPAGKLVTLVGPSGCGKTTLLRCIADLQPPTMGSVILDPVADGSKGEVGFVFQQPALLPWRTALENVVLPLQLARIPGDHSQMAHDALQSVQLTDAADRYPDQLSGGMQMRVSLARTPRDKAPDLVARRALRRARRNASQ